MAHFSMQHDREKINWKNWKILWEMACVPDLCFNVFPSFSGHVTFSCEYTESQKTWTTIAAVWKSTHVPTLTEWFQKMWEILLMEKLIHTIIPIPKVQQTKPLPYTSIFGICPLNMPGANKQYSWAYFHQENKMQYLRITKSWKTKPITQCAANKSVFNREDWQLLPFLFITPWSQTETVMDEQLVELLDL